MYAAECFHENRDATERGGDYSDYQGPGRAVILFGLAT